MAWWWSKASAAASVSEGGQTPAGTNSYTFSPQPLAADAASQASALPPLVLSTASIPPVSASLSSEELAATATSQAAPAAVPAPGSSGSSRFARGLDGIALVSVQPSQVVIAAVGVVAAGTVVSGMFTYRSGSKSLVKDGINPSLRMQMIPIALQTLALSTFFTGCLGAAGFYALKAGGFLKFDTVDLPSAREAGKLMRHPLAFFNTLLKADEKDLKAEAKEA